MCPAVCILEPLVIKGYSFVCLLAVTFSVLCCKSSVQVEDDKVAFTLLFSPSNIQLPEVGGGGGSGLHPY